jgi:acid phosphatase (class A)
MRIRMNGVLALTCVLLGACGSAPTVDPPAAPRPSGSSDSNTGMGTAAATSTASSATGTSAGPNPAPRTPPNAAPRTPPYFAGDVTGLFAVLPPAPKNGDARDEADRRIFRDTRSLAGTPRWQMAAADAELGTGAMLEHFACSLDIKLTTQQAPRIVALLQKASREAAQSVGSAKDFYKRLRPFKVDQGPTCVPASSIGDSFDYPSGHTTAGWAWALTLSQVDPAHAAALLARGRAIGDSRVVCGLHNATAVEGARVVTGAAMAAIAGSEAYQADLRAARTELATLRAGAHESPDPAQCAVEKELVNWYW